MSVIVTSSEVLFTSHSCIPLDFFLFFFGKLRWKVFVDPRPKHIVLGNLCLGGFFGVTVTGSADCIIEVSICSTSQQLLTLIFRCCLVGRLNLKSAGYLWNDTRWSFLSLSLEKQSGQLSTRHLYKFFLEASMPNKVSWFSKTCISKRCVEGKDRWQFWQQWRCKLL